VSILFEPTILKGMSLANRFVRSATWEGMATSDGICTGRLTETMARLAEGGVGLIITGHAYVSREGQASPWQAGIHDDTTIPGLTQMADAVHQQGGRIAVQLAHAGGRAATGLSGLNANGTVSGSQRWYSDLQGDEPGRHRQYCSCFWGCCR